MIAAKIIPTQFAIKTTAPKINKNNPKYNGWLDILPARSLRHERGFLKGTCEVAK